MKTPEDIKRGLECCCGIEDCERYANCAKCPNNAYTAEEMYYQEPIVDALAYIRQLEQRVPRWISVEERLPDKSHDWVLIIGKWQSDGGWIVPHVAEYREGVWMSNGTGWNKIEDLHIKVTHWMPLPEPPEEEK